MYNTRFCPTTNGNLHLGHVFIALINVTEAQLQGGKFVVIFDDDQEIWNIRLGRAVQQKCMSQMLEDLAWLDVPVGRSFSMSEWHSKVEDTLAAYESAHEAFIRVQRQLYVNNSAEVVGESVVYPYHAGLTADKVVMDSLLEIDLLIRGMDLITESSLYAYFCDLWRIPQPTQVYLPRLTLSDGQILAKTGRAVTVLELRQRGISADRVRAVLAESCLKNPLGPWIIDNVKEHPVLDETCFDR